jgi:hypothetical protein
VHQDVLITSSDLFVVQVLSSSVIARPSSRPPLTQIALRTGTGSTSILHQPKKNTKYDEDTEYSVIRKMRRKQLSVSFICCSHSIISSQPSFVLFCFVTSLAEFSCQTITSQQNK